MKNIWYTWGLALLTLLLLLLAGTALTQSRTLALPIPLALPLLLLLLPPLNLVSIPLLRTTHRFPIHTLAPLALLLLETALLSLLATYLPSSKVRTCALSEQWGSLWSAPEQRAALRAIQDAFNCCGFRTLRDRPIPHPEHGYTDEECARMTGRTGSCAAPWGRAESGVAGVGVGVVLGVWVVKIVIAVLVRGGNRWALGLVGLRGDRVTEVLGEGRALEYRDEEVGEEEEGQVGGEGARLLPQGPVREGSGRVVEGEAEGEAVEWAAERRGRVREEEEVV
ncbi:MAG: hypothetical protein M1829_003404 [Trizodia sp. TS-e1964]|nr:MAG: hypothetical protein M1829_003404 [Trizodia sp. TS-e1964]